MITTRNRVRGNLSLKEKIASRVALRMKEKFNKGSKADSVKKFQELRERIRETKQKNRRAPTVTNIRERASLQKLRNRLVESRIKSTAKVPAKVTESTSIPPAYLRRKLKEMSLKLNKVKRFLEEDEMAPAPQAGSLEAQTPGMTLEDGTQQTQTQFSPDILAEIQNLDSSLKNLMTLAGIAPQTEAVPPAPGAEVSPENVTANLTEKINKIREGKRANKPAILTMYEAINNKRKALKERTYKILNESDPVAVPVDLQGSGVNEGYLKGTNSFKNLKGNKEEDGKGDLDFTVTSKTSKYPTWPTPKGTYKKTEKLMESEGEGFESSEGSETASAESAEITESLTNKYLDKIIEKKAFDFNKLIKEGVLG